MTATSPGTGERGTRLWVLVACLLTIASLVPELWSAALRPTVRQQILISSFGLVTLGVAVIAVMRARYGSTAMITRMHLGPWFVAIYVFSFGLVSVSWKDPQTGHAAGIDPASVVDALHLVTVGLVLWTAGYLWGPGVRAARRTAVLAAPPGPARLRSPAALWALFGVGLVASAVQIASGHFGYLGDPSQVATTGSQTGHLVATVATCSRLAMVAATIEVYRRREASWRIVLGIMLAVNLSLGLLSGMKQDFVLTLLGLAVVGASRTGRLPWRGILLAIFAFLLVVVPFNATYRTEVRSTGSTLSPRAAIGIAPGTLARTFGSQPFHQTLGDSSSYLTERFREIDSVAIVEQDTPSYVPFLSSTELVEGPILGLVPRALWAGKPVFNQGYLFNQTYYGLSDDQYTSSAITPVGDLYRHGGLIVLILGMLFLGILCRFVDATFHPRRDPRLAIVFVPVFASLVGAESDLVSLLAQLPIDIGLSLVVIRLLYRNVPVPAAPPVIEEVVAPVDVEVVAYPDPVPAYTPPAERAPAFPMAVPGRWY